MNAQHHTKVHFPCRRTFLADAGMGFTGLALGALLQEDGYSAEPVKPHVPAKATSVIWIFLAGGVSHMESFDIKPALNRYAGKTFDETPFADFLDKDPPETQGAEHRRSKIW